MKILILGSGMMGPAVAFNALANPAVSQVIMCDMNQEQLTTCAEKLAGKPGAEKLGVVRLDLNNQEAAVELMAKFDAIVAALPWSTSRLAIQTALTAGCPLVDLAKPADDDLLQLRATPQAAAGFVIVTCGLEPGLTEIMARHLAESLDRVDELHIKCGGIPAKPVPPLGYKIVFGGRRLPLHESEAHVVEKGELRPVARYSGVEPITVAGVGLCEAWHEGFIPWLLDIPALENLRAGTQKTVRWPGYAAKVSVLKEMGLLSETTVRVDGVDVIPRRVLDELLYPRVKLEEGDRDIVVFRVEVLGQKAGRSCRLQVEMVDHYDESQGFSAMARTTGYTASIVAQMIGRGDLRARGLVHPEQIITGRHFFRLLDQLAAHNINFKFSEAYIE